MMDKVKEFWDTQAQVHKAAPQATSPDVHYRELEITRIIDHIGDNDAVLDVGCGNGYSTLKFSAAKPNARFIGIDYSTEMIAQAKGTEKVWFEIGNVLNPWPNKYKPGFDTIISTRCLINLANWGEQQQALLNMKAALRPFGKIVLVENTIDGLKRLNKLRKDFGLPEIDMRWHNHYLPQQDLLDFCTKHFNVEYVANIGGLYYLLSRVIYARYCQDVGEKVNYKHWINELTAQLPHIPCSYSPNMLFVLRNKP